VRLVVVAAIPAFPALGRAFDPADLLWYVLGVLPPAAVHWFLTRRAKR
jgi:hypothetical protein